MLNDHETGAPSPRHWGWKRILFGSVLVLAILVVGILAYDETLKPHDDLKPARDRVPDATGNGYLYLKAQWQSLPQPAKADREKIHKTLAGTEPWDAAWVDTQRAGAAALQEDLKQALLLPEFATPVFLTFRDMGNDTHSWILGPLRVLMLEMDARMRAGDEAGAIAIYHDLHVMVRRDLEGSNSLIALLVAVSLNSMVCEKTCDLFQEGKLDEAKLQELAALWQEDPPIGAIWEEVMKQEIRLTRSGIEMLGAKVHHAPGPKITLKEKLFLKPNKTINELYRQRRPLLRHFSQPSLPLPLIPAAEDSGPFGWISYLGANYYGNMLIGNTADYGKTIPALTESVLFRPRALRVRIAIHRWQLQHPGQWPADLQELVPDFLPEVPQDPWNGKPLMWDAAAKIITAVGSDGTAGPANFHPARRSWFSDDREQPGLRMELPPLPTPAAPAQPGNPAQTEPPD